MRLIIYFAILSFAFSSPQAFAEGNSQHSYMEKHKGKIHDQMDRKFSKSVYKKVQKALNDQGFDVPVNGVLDTKSRNALARFQQKMKMAKAKGQVDHNTLVALGIR